MNPLIAKLLRRVCGYPLTRKERDRLETLKRRAHHIQNKIDSMPRGYEMGYSKRELSAICWAVEKISGEPFSTVRPAEAAGGEVKSG